MGTFTVTIAAPGVFTLSAHGMVSGDVIYLTTTGALPTGLSANTLYWVTVINSSTFNVSTSFANYSAGTKVTTTGTQSGTHTARRCPWGLGDGSSTFTLPDLREAAPVGIGTRGVGVAADTYNLGQFKDDQLQGHKIGISSGQGGHTHSISDPGHFHAKIVSTMFNDGMAPDSAANAIGAHVDRTAVNGTNYWKTSTDSTGITGANSNTLPAMTGDSLITDGTNGTPRTGTTTRGKRLGVNFIIKY